MSEFVIQRLSRAVSANKLGRSSFDALALGLKGQQQRLFLHLCEHPDGADTVELRMACSIGNISEAAISLNQKLEEQGDPRRVKCTLTSHRNRFGEKGSIGHWRLIDSPDQQQAA